MTRLCRIELAHEHFGDLSTPLRLAPEVGTERVLRQASLVIRPDGSNLDILHGPGFAGAGPSGQAGLELAFSVIALDPSVPAMTAGIGQTARIGEMRLSPGLDWQRFETASYRSGTPGDGRLAVLRLTIPPRARDLTYRLRFPTVAVHWVYVLHRLATGIPVEITDARGVIRFRETSSENGPVPIRTFRSEAPLPVIARGAASSGFRLLRDGRAVALNLPSAAPEHLMPDEDGAQIALMDVVLG